MIPVAAVTRIAMMPLALGWNVIPVDRMNNAHPINVTYHSPEGATVASLPENTGSLFPLS